jgi:hypothetical protein
LLLLVVLLVLVLLVLLLSRMRQGIGRVEGGNVGGKNQLGGGGRHALL